MEDGKKVILLIEDEAGARMVWTTLLEHEGYRVFQEADGLAGLERARKVKPDLILTDIRMPRMDGIEAARAIQDDPTIPAMPIVAVSAERLDPERRTLALELFELFLEKPVSPRDLRRHIKRLLD